MLRPLRAAKERLRDVYSQAFVPQSLPEALAFFVERSLLWWDPLELFPPRPESNGRWGPLQRQSGAQLEGFDWFGDLAAFTELFAGDDPDADLVPQIVQKCIFPEVSRRIRECWDITSARQSTRVAELLDECLLFEVDEDASSFAGLLEATAGRLEQGLAEHVPEVFVSSDKVAKWYASGARRTYLWRSCKIAHCALLLEGRLPDSQLSQLVLTGVFSTRLAPHLRAPRLDPEELAVLERFAAALPERWLKQGLPLALGAVRDALGPRAPACAEAAATAQQAARVLQRLRCFDEAQVLLGAAGRPVVTS